MRSATIVVASLLACLPNVMGHGYLKSVAIDGKTYQGNVPNNPTGEFVWPVCCIR